MFRVLRGLLSYGEMAIKSAYKKEICNPAISRIAEKSIAIIRVDSENIKEAKSCNSWIDGSIPNPDSPDYLEWKKAFDETLEDIEKVLEKNRLIREKK